MVLRDAEWKGYYYGGEDILRDAFIPALQDSAQYDRITGDYSSLAIAVLNPGLTELVDRGGSIRIIAGLGVTEEDAKAIRRGEQNDVVADRFSWDAVKFGDRSAVREALAWLVSEEILKFRIGAVADDGEVLTREEAEWHQKVALFTDENEDTVSIVGSPNESFKALERNRESITLSREWVENPDAEWDDRQRIEAQRWEFEMLWHNNSPDAEVITIPKALKENLLRDAPETRPDLKAAIAQSSPGLSRDGEPLPATPRPYQRDALTALFSNENHLLMKHATGTGKTWTALFALRSIAASDDVVIILTPQKDLIEQWTAEDNLGQFFPDAPVIRCWGEERWRSKLYHALMDPDRSAPVFAISTMHHETMADLFDLVGERIDADQRIVIADEVHRMGAPTRRGKIREFDAEKARIGLSATPLSSNQAGNKAIAEYFSTDADEIDPDGAGATNDDRPTNPHEVSLHDAINEHEVLSPYRYTLHIVSLSEDERQRYRNLSQELVSRYEDAKSYDGQPIQEVADRNSRIRSTMQERAAVLKECEEKTAVTAENIDTIGNRTIIFANDEDHMREVKDRIDQQTGRSTAVFYGELNQQTRDERLNRFEAGDIEVIASIDCLTEGIDVPDCDSAIIIANSQSERKAVQRRGRVLRESEKSDYAELHDFLVLPVPKNKLEGNAELVEAEINLVENELDRVERMNEEADNAEENKVLIQQLRMTLNKYSDNA